MRIRGRHELRCRHGACRDTEHGAEQVVRFAQRAFLLERTCGVLQLMRDRRVLREQQRDDEEDGLS
jgi:hypothetical protein